MIIEETKIPNVTAENIDKSKLILAENIIQNIYPLFDEVYKGQVSEIEVLKNQLAEKKKLVLNEKDTLQTLADSYKQKKKVAKLLDRIDKLINAGLVYDGALKHETTILLKIATKLSDEKLDFHLSETLKIISKRFSI